MFFSAMRKPEKQNVMAMNPIAMPCDAEAVGMFATMALKSWRNDSEVSRMQKKNCAKVSVVKPMRKKQRQPMRMHSRITSGSSEQNSAAV